MKNIKTNLLRKLCISYWKVSSASQEAGLSVLLAFPLSSHLSPKVNRASLKILLGKRCEVPGVDLVRIRKGKKVDGQTERHEI